MTEINNENGKTPKKTEGAAPKKKLNIVFRSQNSTNLKELPKGLKNVAEGAQKKARPLPQDKTERRTDAASEVRRPRPLPAGTKPVKPAVFGVQKDEKETAGPETVIDKTTASVPEKEKAAAVNETKKAAEKTVKEAVKSEEKTAEAEKKAVKAEEKAAEVKEQIKAEAVNKAPNKSENKKAEVSDAQKNTASEAENDAPKIKIVKSYANYDASKVIKEAQAAAKAQKHKNSEGRDGERRPQGERPQGDRSQGRRPAPQRNAERGEGKDQERKPQGGRTFVARGSAAPGGRDGQGRLSQGGRGGQSQTSSKDFGGSTQKPSSAKNKNAFSAKDKREKKDKYRDDIDIQKNVKTGKGAFVKPEPKQEKPEDEIKVIVIPETLTIKDLSNKLKIQPSVIVKKLFLAGKMVTPNTELGYEEAEEIAMEYDILCEKEVQEDVIAELLKEDEEDEARLISRSPVVCVMGHVDHGKTSLLDAIRNTNVTSREAGGITQHIGASVVKINGRNITFLDTPGHEAFTAMRLRGAQSTDIAVLVVAADDGVKPQTVEAINHAKSAGVTVVVAINKMDKPTANIDMVKNALAEYELIPEEWGGSTTMVPVSAKTGEGISDLLEMILLQADVLELKADPNRNARGLVIEAELDKGRGPVATVLVQKGTLNIGDNVAAGSCYGKVRAMIDDKGNRIKKAGPSTPVEILGLNDVPNAGEVFMACHDEKEARNIAETFIAEHKKHMLEETKQKMNLDDLYNEIQAGNIKELPIIVKADVQGSVEAVKQSLGKLSNEEVAVKVVHAAVGNINESDVSLASAANAVIIGFNVKPDPTAKSVAEQEKVDIRLYRVIYQAIEDLQAALTGMLAPVYEEKDTGRAIIRQLFKASGVGVIAGCYVTDGVIERGSKARIFRNDKKIFDGDILSLKRFKDEVKEVKTGFECGMVFDDFSDVAVDDNIEIYKMVQVPRDQVKKDK